MRTSWRLLRVLAGAFLVTAPWGEPASLFADDTVETGEAASKLTQARALVKEGKWAESLPVYDQVLAVKSEDRGLWAEAAQAAQQAKQARRALRYGRRALDGADEAFRASEAGSALAAVLPKLEALVQRQDGNRKRMEAFLTRALEGATRHAAITLLPALKKAKEKGTFELKDSDKMFEDGFLCRVKVEKEGHVQFSLAEWYEEESRAKARFDAVLETMRAQKDLWQRSHVHATAQRSIPLYEVTKPVTEGAAIRRSTAFCWSEVNCATTTVAYLDLVGPGSGPPDASTAHLPPRWLVLTAFASFSFRIP
jgi:tetratricopeptide (TPR) repeat protein